jgi:hypothetical protein
MSLAEALLKFPELPLISLSPADFYGDETTYQEHVANLEHAVDADPWQAEVNLLLAYHRFRQDENDRIRAPLARALAVAELDDDEDLADSILTLWDGAVMLGKAEGSLTAAELPEDQRGTDGPAEGEAESEAATEKSPA